MVEPMIFDEEKIPTFDELLDDLTDEEVRILSSHTEKVEFVPGETIFYEDEPSNYLYIVQQGSVEISKMTDEVGEEYVAFVTLRPGNVFGEMSFLMNTKTSATAVAKDHVVLYRINRNAFEDMIENHAAMACKIYQAICQILVYRLKRTDSKLVDLSAKFGIEDDSTVQSS